MTTRVHLVLSRRDRDAFKARAHAEGTSLSEWLRQAAWERLARSHPRPIRSVEDLDQFFAERRELEHGREPDWDEHLAVAAGSRRGDMGPT